MVAGCEEEEETHSPKTDTYCHNMSCVGLCVYTGVHRCTQVD